MPVQTMDKLKKRLDRLYGTYKTCGGWRKISALDEFKCSDGRHIPPGTLNAIWKHGREPMNPEYRRVLGLPALVPAPACKCGQVHLRKSCPNNPRWYDLDEIPTNVLRWQLENRAEIGDE